MRYDDAVLLLDEPIDGYSKNQIRSKERGLWVVKSKYGLAYCTHDWPAPYNPSEADKKADDWEIFQPNKETGS